MHSRAPEKNQIIDWADMSQAGKVLHLYVEVRSVPEEDEKVTCRGDGGTAHLMLQCPDVLTHSQRNSTRSTPIRSPDLSPVAQHHTDGNHSFSPSKSSSRHSVSFQLQSPDTAKSPTPFQNQDLFDSFGHLLEVLEPKTSSVHSGSVGCAGSPDMNVYTPTPKSSNRLTLSSTSNCKRKPYGVSEAVDDDGRTSVVSFGYIEKASVQTAAERRSSLCLNETNSPLHRMEGHLLSTHLRKRMSDPVWYSSQLSDGDTFHTHRQPPHREPPQSSTRIQRTTVDAVARDATCRALEEFGSPELRRRFAGHSPTLVRHHQAPRCRSLGGSPVLSRSTLTLPSKNQLLDLDRQICRGSLNGLPRSPATDHLCAQTGHPLHSAVSTPTLSSAKESSSRFHPPLPAGRPTDIQHELPIRNFSGSSYQGGDSHHSVNSCFSSKITNTSHLSTDSIPFSDNLDSRTLYKPSRCSSRASDVDSLLSDLTSASPSSNAELDGKPVTETNRRYVGLSGKLTPSPTPSQADSLRSDSPKSGGSFLKESQLHATAYWQGSLDPLQLDSQSNSRKAENAVTPTRPGRISPLVSQRGSSSPACPSRLTSKSPSHSSVPDLQQKCSSPTKDVSALHRYQLPQYTGNQRSPGTGSLLNRSSRDRRQLSSYNTEDLQMSWSSRKQEWREALREAEPVQDGGENCCRLSSRTHIQSKEEGWKRDKLVQEYQKQVLSLFNDRREAPDLSGGAGIPSQSSSGVTGSLRDGSQLDRNDGLSPETSSQLSNNTTISGSGMQSDVGSVPTLASRSQKIAQAKWEFLFGDQREDGRCSKGAPPTLPPSSASQSPTPPSSLRLKPAYQRRGRGREGQRVSHHDVRQIEVELVTPHSQGPAPKTGIIGRSIKYSETDLDAVPLRCYRETDLDEVMRAEAEAEAAEEADSAFGSNLGNSSFSPTDSSPKPRMGGAKEEDGEEDEEEQEEDDEEGVVSWASVRMQGDRQRQRAAKEEDEVFSLLLKGTLGTISDTHGGLKSPISVSSPRRPSDSNLDSFSRHFESIMESHRAKGTSYSSLDSVDLLTSGSTSVFTFDLPTLTPEIQSQICESAKQIELSFAPLTNPAPSPASEMSRSEISLIASGYRLRGGPKDHCNPPVRSKSEKESWRCVIVKDGFRKACSVPSLHSDSRERPVNRPPELLYPQADVAERLALGGSDDALTNGLKPDLEAAKRLAKRLYNLDGFKKSDVARHLSKNNEFSQMVAEEYLSYFDFGGLTIDQSLRTFLTQFALMGETQERERVLSHFSRRYRKCNPESLTTEDSIHTLTCAIMLLNTDLHGNNVGKRMSCSQFISNLEGLNDGRDFPKDLLKTLYSSIKNEKLQWTIDEEELRKSMSELADVRTDSASHTMKRLGTGGNPLVGVAHQVDGELYKSGFLVRKVHADPDGKRTPRGKRGWKSYYAMLKGLVLYLQKDEYRAERELTEEDVKNAVSIHHSLALRAADYSKRPNVFYLRTADWRVFLFQAPNGEQMQSWITRINLVAATFSAPPFPAAIGSQKRFSRPLLPGSNTKLSQEEQAKSHEGRFRAVSSELLELTAATPDRKVKGRELEEQKLRKEYLEFEKTRYGTYAMLLRAKLSSGVEDLTAFETRLFDDGGLQRAHSSPTLPQDGVTKEKGRSARTSKSLKVTSYSSPLSAAVKSSSSVREGGGKKNGGGNNQRAELQKQTSRQEEAA